MAPKKKEKNLNQIAKHFNSGGSQSRAIENEIHQCITDLFLLKKGMYVSSGTPSNRAVYEVLALSCSLRISV